MERRAVVMGATSGIGMEVARLLARSGWIVGIAGRRVDRLLEVEASENNILCHKAIDVTCGDAPGLLAELIEELGGMDLYFHSSGIGWQNNLLDEEKEIRTVGTNGVGFVRMVDAAFNWFSARAAGGESPSGIASVSSAKPFRIACITSIAGTKGLGAAPAYSATKRMQNHYLECLSQLARMRRLPIRITDIRPGFVATDLISGNSYPLQLRAADVARHIVRAVERGSQVVTIDWRYAILVFFWRLIPRWLWIRLRIMGR